MRAVSWVLACTLLALSGACSSAPKSVTAELTRRKDPGPDYVGYNGSAYSFRQASSDDAVLRNYADFVLNNCGLVHIRPIDDMANRIAILGRGTLKDTPNGVPDGWWSDAPFRPAAGMVCLLDIAVRTERMKVKIRFESATPDKVRFTWRTLEPLSGGIDRSEWGSAGEMGYCVEHEPGTESGGPAGSGTPASR